MVKLRDESNENRVNGIRVNGIPEASDNTADELLTKNFNAINNILDFIGVQSTVISMKRLGQYDMNNHISFGQRNQQTACIEVY